MEWQTGPDVGNNQSTTSKNESNNKPHWKIKYVSSILSSKKHIGNIYNKFLYMFLFWKFVIFIMFPILKYFTIPKVSIIVDAACKFSMRVF